MTTSYYSKRQTTHSKKGLHLNNEQRDGSGDGNGSFLLPLAYFGRQKVVVTHPCWYGASLGGLKTRKRNILQIFRWPI